MCYSRSFPIRGWPVSKPRNLFQSPNATANPRRRLLGSPLGGEGQHQSAQAERDQQRDEEDADLERRDRRLVAVMGARRTSELLQCAHELGRIFSVFNQPLDLDFKL